MRYYFILIAICVFFSSCSFITLTPKAHPPIQKEEMSLSSKNALAKSATANLQLSEKIYYEGTDAKSIESEALRNLAYRLAAILGMVPENINIEDLENTMVDVIEGHDRAIEEKNAIIDKLERDVKNALVEKAASVKEINTYKSRWKTSLYSFIILFIVIVIIAGVIQATTGIPVASMIFGGITFLFKGLKQVSRGIQEARIALKEELNKEDISEDERRVLERTLKKIDESQDKHQDESTKKYISKIKKKL